MKFTKKLFLGLATFVISLSLVITSCQKHTAIADSPANRSARHLSVYLTDDPCQYDSVFIDIRYVEVKIDTSTQNKDDDHEGDNDHDADHDDDGLHHDQYGKWDTLTIRPGVYNIAKLRNGVDTLLGTANIPAGRLRKIRLTLGTNNSLGIAGVSYPLSLMQGTNNYVYVKLDDEDEDDITPTQSALWIDFNICESIKMVGSQYYLKPYLKAYGKDNSGEIEGKVFPAAANAFITARSATDSASARPEKDGEFEMEGLRQGTYSIIYKGSAGYKDTTVSNIQVLNGKKSHLPTITLNQ